MLKKILISIFLLVTISSCDNGNSPTNHDFNAQLTSKIDKIGDSLTSSIILNGRNSSVPGVFIGVLNPDNNFSYLKSFGIADISTNTPFFRSDRIRIGSLTQSFIATLALRMVDENKINLDDYVNKYITLPHSGSIIKIRHLLDMSSGIADFSDSVSYYQELEPKRKFTKADILKFAFDATSVVSPGIEKKISNTNYLILSMILEKVSGESISDLISTKILNVLKLDNTHFNDESILSGSPYSHGYLLTETNGFFDYTSHYDYSWSWGSSNMTSNANDLLTWIEAVSEGRLISNNSLNLMQKFEKISDLNGTKRNYGMGLMRLGSYVGFTSSFYGYYLSAYNLPNRNISIIVFSNSYNNNDDVLMKIARYIMPDITFDSN